MLYPLILAETLRRQPAALEGWDTRVRKGGSSPKWPPAGCSSLGSKLPLLCLRGWRRRCSILECLLSKTALYVQCKVAGKDWGWNGVFHQHQYKTWLKVFLHAIFSLLRGSDFANFFLISNMSFVSSSMSKHFHVQENHTLSSCINNLSITSNDLQPLLSEPWHNCLGHCFMVWMPLCSSPETNN